jgi:hypothetical protein
MARTDDELIDNILRCLIYRPFSKRKLATRLRSNWIKINKIVNIMKSKFLVKEKTLARTKFTITKEGIDLLIAKRVVVLKYFYRLRIYDKDGRTIIEEYFTTKIKAKTYKEQYEYDKQIKLNSQYFEIDEIQVK